MRTTSDLHNFTAADYGQPMNEASVPSPTDDDPDTQIDWCNLIWVGLAITVMIAAILSADT